MIERILEQLRKNPGDPVHVDLADWELSGEILPGRGHLPRIKQLVEVARERGWLCEVDGQHFRLVIRHRDWERLGRAAAARKAYIDGVIEPRLQESYAQSVSLLGAGWDACMRYRDNLPAAIPVPDSKREEQNSEWLPSPKFPKGELRRESEFL